jgi:hypothetical protein
MKLRTSFLTVVATLGVSLAPKAAQAAEPIVPAPPIIQILEKTAGPPALPAVGVSELSSGAKATTVRLQKNSAESPSPDVGDPVTPPILTAAPASRLYGGAEFLFYWVKGAPLSVPLVSTGPIRSTHHGLLGPPAPNGGDSTILYGAQHLPAQGGRDVQNFRPFFGGRLTAGYWLDDSQRFAIEGSGFSLGRRSTGFTARGDLNYNPILGIPVHNSVAYQIGDMTIPPGEDSLPFSLPNDPDRSRGNGIIIGGINITNSLRLWGSDVVGVINLYRGSSLEVYGLIGFRYLDLSETFNLNSDIEGVSGPYQGQSGVVSDTFQTRNHFYGQILGLRGSYIFGALSLDLTARVAIGYSHEVQNIWGAFVSHSFPSPTDTGPEGVFAQPANEGRRAGNRFSMIPEAQLKARYAVTPWMSVSVGYDFLYYSNVLRPTDQIDRNLPKGQTFLQAAPAISTTSPAQLFQTTDFFAHGLNFGLEFRY